MKTATTRFIEDIVKGGWNPKPMYYSPHARLWGIEVSGDDNDREKYLLSQLLLDPTAWQAVGKVRGWLEEIDDPYYCRCEVTGKKTKRNPAWLADCLCHRQAEMKSEWKTNLHDFIDHLADGKSVEESLLAIE